jgi:hypothetical protein
MKFRKRGHFINLTEKSWTWKRWKTTLKRRSCLVTLIGKDLEGSSPIKILSWYLPGRSEEP